MTKNVEIKKIYLYCELFPSTDINREHNGACRRQTMGQIFCGVAFKFSYLKAKLFQEKTF